MTCPPAVGPESPEPKVSQPARPSLEAGLYVVATPIGNLRDVTLRALEVLAGADLLLAEDTRVTRKLLDAHGLSARLVSYHEHNAEARTPEILAALEAGKAVALVSDAGTPLVSDPGARLVAEAIAAGFKVVPVPGASAVLAALVAAGLPADRFLFAGFAPPKAGARRAFLAEFATAPATLVFYESGPRLADSLADMAEVLGDRPAAVCRELTKFFEEIRRGSLSALAAQYQAAPRGEIVVVVGPPLEAAPPGAAAIDAALAEALAAGSVKDAAAVVADRLGLPRRAVYARALALRAGGDPGDAEPGDPPS